MISVVDGVAVLNGVARLRLRLGKLSEVARLRRLLGRRTRLLAIVVWWVRARLPVRRVEVG